MVVTMDEYILQMQGITKIYENGFIANKDVNLSVKAGEIHALMGENGAGKTTLMKILFGLEDCQEGRILIKGSEVKIHDPLDAIAHGIGMVHQHFMQIPKFTVAENIVLGIEPTKGAVFDQKEAVRIAQEVADKYQFDIDVNEILEDISVGKRQKVELLKALVRGVELLILDEPTAVLTPQETAELFEQLRRLRSLGISIIFISHKLDEIMSLCDRVTVLRKGHTVGGDVISNLTQEKLAEMMVGRAVALDLDKPEEHPGKPVVDVRNLVYVNHEGRRVLNNLTFQMREGEILGIAGVEGNGQSEICDILAGMLPVLGGSVVINGKDIQNLSVREIRELGVAHISEDRMKYGCAASLSVKDNIMADRIRNPEWRTLGLFLNHKKINRFIDDCIKEFEITCDDRNSPVKMLSGGNIQKVVIAREFTSGANVIIANQPTRGVDVGATEFIRRKLVSLSRSGAAVLVVSADLNEVMSLADRLMVFHNGHIAAHWKDAKSVTETMLGEYMLGVRKMSREEVEAGV